MHFQWKTIIIACPKPTKFEHSKGGPQPCPSSLNAIPKLVFDWFTRVGRPSKNALLGSEVNVMQALHSLTTTTFILDVPHEGCFLIPNPWRFSWTLCSVWKKLTLSLVESSHSLRHQEWVPTMKHWTRRAQSTLWSGINVMVLNSLVVKDSMIEIPIA